MITSLIDKVTYDISGGAPGTFPIPFEYQDHLEVIVVDSLGDSTLLVLDVDYSETGSTLTRLTDWSAYTSVTINRITALTQPEDFRNGDRLEAERTEAALDRVVMQIQEARGIASKAIVSPDTTLSDLPKSTDRAFKVLVFDEDGDVSIAEEYVKATQVMVPFIAAASLLAAQKALGLLDESAVDPISSAAMGFLESGSAAGLAVPANRFGETTLQGLLTHLDPTITHDITTYDPGTITINGYSRITVGTNEIQVLEPGPSIQIGDRVVVRATYPGVTLDLGAEMYSLPVNGVEVFVYDPSIKPGYNWVPTFRRPRREPMGEPVLPDDYQLVTTAYVKRRLSNLAVSSWVARSAAAAYQWKRVCWSPKLQLFAAVALDGAMTRIMTSPDGVTWTGRLTPVTEHWWLGVCWSPELELFVAVGSVTPKILHSVDGIDWWVQFIPVTTGNLTSVCWSPELGLFCAVASGGTTRILTSDNGTTFTERSTPAGNTSGWTQVCWSPELGLFCAVGQSGGDLSVMISPNGIDWSSSTAFTSAWNSVCWSPELGLFCAVSSSSTSNIMTSSNGIDWSVMTAPFNAGWRDICWSPELGVFCAVGRTGAVRIMTSADGANWVGRSYPSDSMYDGVCWSPELMMFCAVAVDGSSRVATTLPIIP